MPTLLEKSKINKSRWMSRGDKTTIDNMSGIEFLMDLIAKRVGEEGKDPVEPVKSMADKVLVLKSGTGSGKSTLLPPFLYKRFLSNGGNLVITQPTKATVMDIPYQVVKWNKFLKMGENIGYQTGDNIWKPKKGILFSTYGILLQYLKIMTDEEFMSKFRFIIIDEVHGRTIDIDNCLFYLKKLFIRNWDNPKCPYLILMSATFDPKIFMDYFKCKPKHYLEVSGSTYTRHVEFLPFAAGNYVNYCVARAEKIHLENQADIENDERIRDILIFVQGSAQMRSIEEKIHRLNSIVFSKGLEYSKDHLAIVWEKYTKPPVKGGGFVPPGYLMPIFASSKNMQEGGKEYKNLFENISEAKLDIYEFDSKGITDKVIATVVPSRRVVIGTNAIETGMTIETLKYCIDSGYVKESSFNPVFGCQILVDKAVTKASSDQRKGRIGRMAPGWFYPAYEKSIYDNMRDLPLPSIITDDITNFVLSGLIKENETTLETIDKYNDDAWQMNQFDQKWYSLVHGSRFKAWEMDFIQYPAADNIVFSLEKLHHLGFIDGQYRPTIFGYYADKFRKISLESIRMILHSYANSSHTLDLITIACFISVGFKFGQKYVPRDPLDLGSTSARYYNKMIFCSEWVEFLFIWDEFSSVVEKVGKQMEKTSKKSFKPVKGSALYNYLNKYAEENGFNVYTLLSITALRDEVIKDMMTIGLDPYYNGIGMKKGSYNLVNIIKDNIEEGMGEIKKIKECIYEGYRYNVCKKVGNKYVSAYTSGTIVLDTPLVQEIKWDDSLQDSPQYIIVANITLLPSRVNKGMYEFSGSIVDVMDGFTVVDDEFLLL